VAGLHQLHATQRRRPGEQRVEADVFGRDGLERGGGAEVHHHYRAAEEIEGGDGVGDAVGAHLLGVVVEDGQPGADARLHDHGRLPEVALAHPAQRPGHPGHRRAHADAGDVVVEREAVEAQELLDDQRMLVGGALGVGGDAPVVEQMGVSQRATDVVLVVGLEVVEPDDGLRVADVDDQEHHGLGG
jgi:hypothetical protein